MATCLTLSQQIAAKCRNATPGLSTIWLANYTSFYPTGGTSGYGFTLNSTEDQIDSWTGVTEAGYSSGFFYPFVINRENGSFIDPVEVSIANGTRSFKPELSFKISSLSTEVRNIFKQLSEATVIAVVKDNEGNYYCLGKNNGMDLSAGRAESGEKIGDMKGVTFTLTGWESAPYIELANSTILTDSVVTV